MQTFKLIPYPAGELPKIQVTGEIDQVENILSLHYAIRGEAEDILLPAFSAPSRKDDLWKATCFEFFIALPGSPEYWEFNMSPSSEWNAYRMDAYRQVNMREETQICQLPFEFQKEDDGYSLDISVDLNPIILPAQNIQVGVTAIIQTKDGNETYWALAHPGSQADFHLRESFVLGVRSLPTSA